MTLRMHVQRISVLAGVMGLLCGVRDVRAQTSGNVLVVMNRASDVSQAVAQRYVERRSVPAENLCAIDVTTGETVTRDVFEAKIEQPIWQCIATTRSHDRILYIVLTKDVPIRVAGTPGRGGTNASVDSELTLLYRRRTGIAVPVLGFVPNPYFAGAAAPTAIKPFTHEAHDIYLVTRLDGYTQADVFALIDRSLTPARDGRFVLDGRASHIDRAGNAWLRIAADRLKSEGIADSSLVLDDSPKVLSDQTGVLGYYSWGSNDEANRTRTPNLEFAPGAIAGMFVNTDARTFREPPAAWRPGDESVRETSFAGSHQSLTADLIRAGVTGAAGHVNEPFLDATIRPDILFPAYVAGRNLAESYYAAMPYLSWQTIVIGDPLCAPFPHTTLAADAIDPGLDSLTEMPAYFGRRELAEMPAALNRKAAAAFIRFESRKVRKDAAGMRQALETAVAEEPRFIPARLELALQDQREGRHDRAIAQYREILTYSPNDAVSLNNLAFALAVYENNPVEALPMAERAVKVADKHAQMLGGAHLLSSVYTLRGYELAPPIEYVLDTLAWVQHMLGRDLDATTTIASALVNGTHDPEVLWHAAVIYAAVSDLHQATAILNLAVRLEPGMAEREDVKKLRLRLTGTEK